MIITIKIIIIIIIIVIIVTISTIIIVIIRSIVIMGIATISALIFENFIGEKRLDVRRCGGEMTEEREGTMYLAK